MGTPFRRLLVWFRRDLRLHDNPALYHALEDSETVVPVFVLTDSILGRADTGARRVRFLCDSLSALDAGLRGSGASLAIRRGDPADVIPRLLLETQSDGVYFHDEAEPAGRERDARVTLAVRGMGREARAFPGLAIVPPDALRTRAGAPYTVYTPYARAWRGVPRTRPLPAPESIPGVRVGGLPLPTPGDCGFADVGAVQQGGEGEGRRRLFEFAAARLARYDTARDIPSIDGTSGISAHLKFGTLSPREVREVATSAGDAAGEAGSASADRFVGELAWRDFYAQVLHHHPRVERSAFQACCDGIAWENDPALVEAWKRGQTGYPIVDAGMRQLAQDGWMHNRVRMIVASFLTKDLLCDWRIGEQHFMEQLVDGDLASNNGGWQWAASTGTDAQPYFRVFNPVAQGRTFDPDGAYVQRYVPELASVPDWYIHCPWEMAPVLQRDLRTRIGQDYPAPIVNHPQQRERAIAMYRNARGGTAA